MEKFDAKQQTQNCIQWIKDWFAKESGGAEGAVIGISGGKDSTVVAALLCRAIGKEQVLGIMMPNGMQKDIEDSIQVCKLLQIPNMTVNIEKAYSGVLTSVEDGGITLTDHTKTNIAPRIRMLTLYAIGQEKGYRVAGTGNASERYVGYATKWGDMACDFNPIGEFLTEEVIAIGRELGLPEDLICKTPADGLTGKSDEDNLGFSYEQLNTFIKTGKVDDKGAEQKIKERHQYSLHKLRSIPMYSFHRYGCGTM